MTGLAGVDLGRPQVARFAPSPTGFLHIGNARTALYNALIARRTGGTFVLRLDDTDRERSEERFAEAILEDLRWLGIAPDRVERQSARLARYGRVLDDLKAAGLVYPCYETAEELDYKRRRQRARGLPPVYDRSALRLGPDERSALEAEGRRPHWRFRLPVDPSGAEGPQERLITWADAVRGEQTVKLSTVSDPVLVRADGSYLYTFPSVVDDIDFGVTLVLRGEDHVVNTGVQIAIFDALGAAPPAFGHHNLIVTADGEGLSKRSGALSLRQLRADGYEPEAVAALATLIGTSADVTVPARVADLAGVLDLAAISRSPARFDPTDLDRLNASALHAMDYARARPRLAAMRIDGGAEFWNAIRANLSRFDEARHWWDLVFGEVTGAVDPADADYVVLAAELLPGEPFDGTTFGAWTGALAQATGRKGRALFQPLRLALTGEARGPELARLLPLLGRRRSADRLLACAAASRAPSTEAPAR